MQASDEPVIPDNEVPLRSIMWSKPLLCHPSPKLHGCHKEMQRSDLQMYTVPKGCSPSVDQAPMQVVGVDFHMHPLNVLCAHPTACTASSCTLGHRMVL